MSSAQAFDLNTRRDEVVNAAVYEFISLKVLLNRFRKSSPPQNRQIKIAKQIVKQKVDDFAGKLTF